MMTICDLPFWPSVSPSLFPAGLSICQSTSKLKQSESHLMVKLSHSQSLSLMSSIFLSAMTPDVLCHCAFTCKPEIHLERH